MNVPAAIEVDVSALDLGESVHVRDLVMPKGAVCADAEDITVLTIVAPSSVKSDEASATPAVATAEGEVKAKA